MLEFSTRTDCPFCGAVDTLIWWRGKAITAIKHKRFEQDRECRGTVAVDPTHHRHMLISNYDRLMEHLKNEAFVREQVRTRSFFTDLGVEITEERDGTIRIGE